MPNNLPPLTEAEKKLSPGERLHAWNERLNGQIPKRLQPKATDLYKGQIPQAVKQLLQTTADANAITLRELLSHAEQQLGYTLTSQKLTQVELLKQVCNLSYLSSNAISYDQYLVNEKRRNEEYLRKHGKQKTPLGSTRYDYANKQRQWKLYREIREQLRRQTGNYKIDFDSETGEITHHEMCLPSEKIQSR